MRRARTRPRNGTELQGPAPATAETVRTEEKTGTERRLHARHPQTEVEMSSEGSPVSSAADGDRCTATTDNWLVVKIPDRATVREVFDWLTSVLQVLQKGQAGPEVIFVNEFAQAAVRVLLANSSFEYCDTKYLIFVNGMANVATFAQTLTPAVGDLPFWELRPQYVGVFNAVAKGLAPVLRDGPNRPIRDWDRLDRYLVRLRTAKQNRRSIAVHHTRCKTKLDELVVGGRDDIRSIPEERAYRAWTKGQRTRPVSREVRTDDPFWHVVEWVCLACGVRVRAPLRDIAEAFLACHEDKKRVDLTPEGITIRRREFDPAWIASDNYRSPSA